MDNDIISYFRVLKEKGSVGPSYFFAGDSFETVKNIAKLINCKEKGFCGVCRDCTQIGELRHPDVFVAEPEPLTIKIESIREAQRFLSLKNFCLKKKIVIIKGADAMGEEAAAAFLKTLEEPPAGAFIALCAPGIERVPATIISRCRRVFLPAHEGAGSFMPAETLAGVLSGKIFKFGDRKKLGSFLWTLAVALRDYIVSSNASGSRIMPEAVYEKILKPCDIMQAQDNLEYILKLYSRYDNINEALAFNLTRSKLGQLIFC